MIAASTYRGQRVAVFGLGRTGISASLSLQKGGAVVMAWDDREVTRDAAAEQGVQISNLTLVDWSQIDALVLSPGVPHALPSPHWVAEVAIENNVPIICDVEIFARELAASEAKTRLVAITGTNGKSTTTTLVGHLIGNSGRMVHVGGNIGRGVLDLPPPEDDAVYVLELSSYQLERAPSLHADVALLLNMSPDHLDRHGDMAGYESAKRNIFANQGKGDTAILGVDDSIGRRICTEMKARNGRQIVPVSTRASMGHGVMVKNAKLFDATGRKVEEVVDLSPIATLRGQHNHQNAACAYAVVRALGLRPSSIARGLKSFPGLAHRMEQIGAAGRVLFVNDSKATNAEAALQALRSYENIHWIAGGLPKAGGIESLADVFPNVTKAYLIGTAAPGFARTLDEAGVANQSCGELDRAVKAAARDAFSSGRDAVILLSPACASFDQYKDFEVRGDAFRDAAKVILAMYDKESKKTG